MWIKLKGAHWAPFFRSSGFSLVELMIVVAIIGLLSAVAIPNFQKFQAKSKTTEAKLQLAGIYTAEASYYGSYNMYHTCLNYMGYDPREFRESRMYTLGFTVPAAIQNEAYQAAVASDLNTTDCPQALSPAENVTFFSAGKSLGSALSDSTHLVQTAIGNQVSASMTYTAGAAGIIHKDFIAATNSSAFTINEQKVIKLIRSGY